MSRESVQWKPSCSMRTDGRTVMTKLTVAFRNFVNAPKNSEFLQTPMKYRLTSCYICAEHMNSGAFALLLPLDVQLFMLTSDALLNWVKQAGSTSGRKISLQRFLGAFAKLRKATISFVMSVFRSVRTKKTWLPLDWVSLNFISEYFSKICRENSSFVKIWRE